MDDLWTVDNPPKIWDSPRTAPQRSCFCPLRSTTPTAGGPSSGYQLAPPFLPTPVPWPLWTSPQRVQPPAQTGPPSPGRRRSHSLPLCRTEVGTHKKYLRGGKKSKSKIAGTFILEGSTCSASVG